MTEDTVFAVASGKGGVGKTTTTVNLGTAIAAAGHRVAVVDADLGMANLAGFVNLSPDDVTLHDVLAGEAAVEEATYEVADGIGVVPSGTDLERYADVDAAGLSDVVDHLRAAFDYVLLDVGAGVSHETVLPLGLADSVLVVVTPEPGSVTDAEKTVDLVDRADGRTRGLVLNKTRLDEDISEDDIAAHVGVELLASVPEDSLVRESLQAGTPLVAYDPESPASIGFRALAAVLVDDAPEPDVTPTEALRRSESAPDTGAVTPSEDRPEKEPSTEATADDAEPVLLDEEEVAESGAADAEAGGERDESAADDDRTEILGPAGSEDGTSGDDEQGEADAETDDGDRARAEADEEAVEEGDDDADEADDGDRAGAEADEGTDEADEEAGDEGDAADEDLSEEEIPFRAEDDGSIEFDDEQGDDADDGDDDESGGLLSRLLGR